MPGRLDPLDDILDSQFFIHGGNLHLGDHDVRDIQPAERQDATDHFPLARPQITLAGLFHQDFEFLARDERTAVPAVISAQDRPDQAVEKPDEGIDNAPRPPDQPGQPGSENVRPVLTVALRNDLAEDHQDRNDHQDRQ